MNFLNNLFKPSLNKINFEDVKYAISHPSQFCIINTLPITDQDCLICTTVSHLIEEKLMNDMLLSYDVPDKTVIVYGQNSQDETAEKKCNQLISLGIKNVYLYSGGMFEWVLLQDIYGEDLFPTTSKVVDLLRGTYKGSSCCFRPS